VIFFHFFSQFCLSVSFFIALHCAAICRIQLVNELCACECRSGWRCRRSSTSGWELVRRNPRRTARTVPGCLRWAHQIASSIVVSSVYVQHNWYAASVVRLDRLPNKRPSVIQTTHQTCLPGLVDFSANFTVKLQPKLPKLSGCKL